MHHVYDFLKSHWDRQSPLLLAFSGGPDSLALLSIILDCQKRWGKEFNLGLAHVDHGWRKESAAEAQRLKAMAQTLSFPFHLKTLNPTLMKGNLEAACRQERLQFFRELCQKFHYQAVILGHHADDQAETVLKKILEGSSALYLTGLRPITQVQGVTLWRPMLGLTKEMIRDWIKDHGLTPIEDETNLDPRFLRGKFRTKIIPQLTEDFGKEVTQPLTRLSCEAIELRDYFDEKIEPYKKHMFSNQLGSFLDLSEKMPSHPIELKYLIKSFCEKSDLSLTGPILEKIIQLITQGVADRHLSVHGKEIFIDRKGLFIKRPFPSLPCHPLTLVRGDFSYGSWNVHVSPSEQSPPPCSHWKALWTEEGGSVVLPDGQFMLGAPCLSQPYPGTTSIRKWWTDHKVPAFLRLFTPVVFKEEKIFQDFLSGKLNPKQRESSSCIEVTLSLRECL